eukprot:286498-Alexandrium_andersonii.AAC.1
MLDPWQGVHAALLEAHRRACLTKLQLSRASVQSPLPVDWALSLDYGRGVGPQARNPLRAVHAGAI